MKPRDARDDRYRRREAARSQGRDKHPRRRRPRLPGVRLVSDQTLENATGAGGPPTEWPQSEPQST
jgi:hypothetical protein